MLASDLWALIDELDSTNSPVETANILKAALERTNEPVEVVRLLTGDHFADFEKELGVGKRSVRKALGQITADNVWQNGRRTELEKEVGDLSIAVERMNFVNMSLSQPIEPTASDLLAELISLQRTGGLTAKIDKMVSILQGFTQPHVVVFAITNDRSFGVSWKTVVRALSEASPFSKSNLERAYGLHPDLGKLTHDALIVKHLETSMKPFRRIAPMLASSADEERAADVYQTKYDGSRLLIHQHDGELRAFSRQQHDITDSIPELDEQNWPIRDFVVDAEAVAYRSGEVQNFQEIMKRFGRIHDVAEMANNIEIEFKVFDCLYFSGIDLTKYEYYKRWDHIEHEFSSFAAKTGTNRDEIMAWSLDNGHEGIIVKDNEAPYYFERDRAWRKIKADPESADVIVTDVFEAEGKLRRKLEREYGQTGIGSVRVETADGIELGNVGTGFKESERVELYDSIEGSIIEVMFDELQEGQHGGYGLRFPRFIRIRDNATADRLSKLESL